MCQMMIKIQTDTLSGSVGPYAWPQLVIVQIIYFVNRCYRREYTITPMCFEGEKKVDNY